MANVNHEDLQVVGTMEYLTVSKVQKHRWRRETYDVTFEADSGDSLTIVMTDAEAVPRVGRRFRMIFVPEGVTVTNTLEDR